MEGVHQLLGRSGRRVGGKEGVGFVLRSLPVNARSLFRILVVEMLVVMDEEGGGGEEEDGEEEGGRGRGRSGEVGVEYRMLYQKAVEDFVCGDEVAFRSLLKEYVLLLLSPLFFSFSFFQIPKCARIELTPHPGSMIIR